MEALTYRNELKYVISIVDAQLLGSRLCRIMQLDRNATRDGTYLTSSLYFDTANDRDLREKQEGVDPRSKWRIRLYNHDERFIRLEKKIKTDGFTTKRSVRITAEQCRRLQAVDYRWLLTTDEPLLRELYTEMQCHLLRPKVVVSYKREAYAMPACDVRVTVDSDVRTGMYNLDLLDRHLPTYPTGQGRYLVLEVKYGHFLPDTVAAALQLGNRPRGSFSKYSLCRSLS